MLTKEKFNQLMKYSEYSSFAIWSSWKNVSDTSMINENNLPALGTNYVFVALNPSSRPASHVVKPFSNFHSEYSHQKDFKLCFALEGTKYWGSYMTDLFKSFHLTDSRLLPNELKNKPDDVERDLNTLNEELTIIAGDITLIALGRKTEKYLRKLFKDKYKIIYATHYSYFSSKENYRQKLLDMLEK